MDIKEIFTARTILKIFTQETFDAAFHHLSDDEQISFLGLNSILELKKEKEKYKNGLSTDNRKFLYFKIFDKATKKNIGWGGFHTWYIDHNRAEIGYAIFDDNYKKMGIMSEVIKKVIEYGFAEMDLNRIEAFIGPGNSPSIKLIDQRLKNFKTTKEAFRKYAETVFNFSDYNMLRWPSKFKNRTPPLWKLALIFFHQRKTLQSAIFNLRIPLLIFKTSIFVLHYRDPN